VTYGTRELIAAATDPFPAANPGWQLRERTSPWLALGDEVADLCRRGGDESETTLIDGLLVPRSWSNAAATAGQDPCVPHRYGDTYFHVVPDTKTILRIRPGEHQTIQLEGFATDNVGLFMLSARPAVNGAATLTLGASKFGPGKSTTLDIALPSSASIGFPVYSYVYSERDDRVAYQWQFVPMPVMAGDPCTAFRDCLSCTARVGCGFCTSSGRCEALGASNSAESSAAGLWLVRSGRHRRVHGGQSRVLASRSRDLRVCRLELPIELLSLEMTPARLIDVIANLRSQDGDLTIYATRPWTCDSLAVVAREPDDRGVPREAASLGAEYFIEVFVAGEFLEGWMATSPGPRSDVDRCERLIQYAIDDA
jgi:hypothetical protein